MVQATTTWQRQVEPITNVIVWVISAVGFVLLASLTQGDWIPSLSEGFREAINTGTGPIIYSLGTTAGLVVLYIFRRFFVSPPVAWTILNAMLLLLGMSMTDRDFY
ncbi:MAG: hypothetical protein RID07_20600, partial [Lacipirellulaceae bacterium]